MKSAELELPETLGEIPNKVLSEYCKVAELWYADHGAVFYRGEIVLAGKAYDLRVYISDLNAIEDSIFEGKVPKKMGVLKMLDIFDDIFGDTLRTDIEDGAEFNIQLSESTAPWELGWEFLVPMLYGAYPTDWSKKFSKEMNKQRKRGAK